MASIQKRYAYCMGANHPQGFKRLHTLQYAERDAEQLARAFLDTLCSFTEARHVIADDSRETVIGLGNFLRQPALQEQDLVVVHFSGHGHLSKGKLYLLCNQTEESDVDVSAINIDAIKDRLEMCSARYKLLILDCCHAGGATEGALKGAHEVEEELAHMLEGSSTAIIAACARIGRTRELAVIDGEEGGGVLSWIMRAACTTRLQEVSGDKRSLSLTDIRGWIPGIINKINSSLAEGEEHLPQPITFYEGQGGAEIWLTEPGKYSGKGSQSIDTTARLRGIVDSQRDFVEDRVGRFVGRELELRDLGERIAGKMKQGGYLIITGDAGQGKSSIIAKMIEQQGIDTCAYHFVQYNSGDDYRTSLLRKLMACLILKYQLPDYYIDSDSYPVLSGNFAHVLAEIAARGAQE
nr:caspase family protein [Chloroflexota bacterium]